MASLYIHDRQEAEFPQAAASWSGLGALFAAEAARHADAQTYARIVRNLLAVVGVPTATESPHYTGGSTWYVKHPDSRVQEAFNYLGKRELVALGIVAEAAPAAPDKALAAPGGPK